MAEKINKVSKDGNKFPVDENQLRKEKRDKRKLEESSPAVEADRVLEYPAEEPKKSPEDIRIGGLEGGGTHSTLVVLDGRGNKLIEIKGPGTNHWGLGMLETASRINGMIVKAKRELKIPETSRLDCVGLNLSGCEREETNLQLTEVLVNEYPMASKVYIIGSDTLGSLKTGVNNGGVVLIAGTGSNSLLLNPDGKSHRCGGWGYMLGDEGSAYWIAHRAIKYVFDDIDGLNKAPHSISYIWPALKNFFHVTDRESLLLNMYVDFEKSKIAIFTKEVVVGCEHGDPLCLLLFEEAGQILAKHVEAVAAKAHNDLKLAHGGIKVVCVGSVWKSWHFMKKGFLDEIHRGKVVDELTLLRLITSAALGSAYLAAEHINCVTVKKEYERNVEVFHHYKRDNFPALSNHSSGETEAACENDGEACKKNSMST